MPNDVCWRLAAEAAAAVCALASSLLGSGGHSHVCLLFTAAVLSRHCENERTVPCPACRVPSCTDPVRTGLMLCPLRVLKTYYLSLHPFRPIHTESNF